MPRTSAAQRRSEFIDAAFVVIAEHGIDGTTTRRIAEQAGANLGTLHYCYNSKEDLFADLYEFVAGKFIDVAKNSGSQSSVLDAARSALRGAMTLYLESPDFAAVTVELIKWALRQREDRGVVIYDRAVDALREALKGASSDRPVAPEAIDQICYVIAILSDGFAASWYTYGDRSAAAMQMDIADSVLTSWLAPQLEATPASS